MDVCHRTMALLLGLNQRRIKHSYSSHTLTMAFLLQHVTALKLWVVGIVYLALELHIISFHAPLPLPFLTPCPASIAHSPYIILWILYCCPLLEIPVNLIFPVSHTMDFFLFFSSAKWSSWCQQNMFFISWKMSPTKTHMAEKDCSKQLMSLTTPDKRLLNFIKNN